jgi:phospholipid-transporting ATPase
MVKGRKNALVINGEALGFALSKELKLQFLDVGVMCHSVICCRVTPLQKALVVKLVKDTLKVVTLAIGDGANDVSMIQAADVGVGIQGREGAQAVRAADYAFGEFRFLRRLLSVHGRWSYHRLTQLIFYSFYKNLTMITVQWWFGFVSQWSGQNAYEEIFMVCYNVIFTSLPPFFLAIFDRDIDEAQIEKYPEAYREIRTGLFWNVRLLCGWLLSAVWHALVIFGSVYLLHQEGVLSDNGKATGYWVQCYLFGTPLLFTVMLKAALATRSWTWFNVAALGVSLLANLVVMFVLELFGWIEVGTPMMSHLLPSYYLLTLLLPIACCLPDLAVL